MAPLLVVTLTTIMIVVPNIAMHRAWRAVPFEVVDADTPA
jgi:hypothetical protein